jgi:DNA-binding CsgD family transcriptional regulator
MLNMQHHESAKASFTVRSLASLTGIQSLSTVRRALDSLLLKLSVERTTKQNGNRKTDQGSVYRAYTPNEVLERRKPTGSPVVEPHAVADKTARPNHWFERALARVADNPMLSRREAQVTLCCVEGLTNAEIGKRLQVSEQTVKFHLRHVFIKFRVKRRAELISRLLM